eukprot:gene15624-21729_t
MAQAPHGNHEWRGLISSTVLPRRLSLLQAAYMCPAFAETASLEFCKLNMGKVHGSLARAGKVRGQTPKVAPQEKKKKPTGRAVKRVKYNRRFVNVVVGFGKKGPNQNKI